MRVGPAEVHIDGERVAHIDHGLAVLLGVAVDDGPREVDWLANKIADLRVFLDDDGKMNRSVLDVRGDVLVVSQFTLLADARRGRRPSYTDAARPEQAIPLYEAFMDALRSRGLSVESGRFGAMMDVALVNRGPVTVIIDTP
jgi:D-tyrosyl-tRNA(Tyr) deacylase